MAQICQTYSIHQWISGTTVLLRWHCITAAVAKFSRCGSNAVLLEYESSPTTVAMQCHRCGRTFPLKATAEGS
ncbi:MAG: hypothetical protein IJ901_04080 [Bacteroidaceae bacterium]|nr:hypothetical protein [Bacteroidaceae bacterium]